MLNNPEKIQIRQLLQTPQWKTAEHLASLLCDKIAYDSKLRDTEWETLRAVLVDEGRVNGIKDFIKELYSNAQSTG